MDSGPEDSRPSLHVTLCHRVGGLEVCVVFRLHRQQMWPAVLLGLQTQERSHTANAGTRWAGRFRCSHHGSTKLFNVSWVQKTPEPFLTPLITALLSRWPHFTIQGQQADDQSATL